MGIGGKFLLFSERTFRAFQAGHSLCSKQDISYVPSRTFIVFHAGHSVCSKQDIPCVPCRTVRGFQAGHSLCATHDISLFPNRKTCNDSKIVRIAPISTIFWRNRSGRSDLVFQKFSRRRIYFSRERKKKRVSDVGAVVVEKVSLRCIRFRFITFLQLDGEFRKASIIFLSD